MKRWHKIALATAGAIALVPLLLRVLFPNYFEAARCVGTLANGNVVKARGDDCKNPEWECIKPHYQCAKMTAVENYCSLILAS